jgi:ribosomal protein L4
MGAGYRCSHADAGGPRYEHLGERRAGWRTAGTGRARAGQGEGRTGLRRGPPAALAVWPPLNRWTTVAAKR